MTFNWRKAGVYGALLGPFLPWVILSFPSGYTVFFSAGYTDSFVVFVDVISYTLVETQGGFWASYWFWHLTVVLALATVGLAVLRYEKPAAGASFLAAMALGRFTLALARHTGSGIVVPVALPWMVGTGIALYRAGRKAK